MPAINPSNTERWYYTYDVGPSRHTMMIRTETGAVLSDVVTYFNALFTAAAPFMYTATTISLERSAKGSNVRLPQSTTGLAATYGSGAPTARDSVFGLAFPGRSLLGAKARLYFLGVRLFGDDNYKYTTAENTAVLAVVNLINSQSTNAFIAVDGAEVNWYNYCTSKQNDHYVGVRRGS